MYEQNFAMLYDEYLPSNSILFCNLYKYFDVHVYCEDNRGCYRFMQKNTSFLCLECDIAGNAG